MTTGCFITFEGGEGTGKSTQAKRLSAQLQAAGQTCIVTREPGGSAFAEHVRDIVLDPETPEHSALVEALLFSAARADHLEVTIRPAIARGDWVICDRFTDSTRAYQGAGGGVPTDKLKTLEQLTVDRTVPDLTFIMDLPVDAAFRRVADRHGRNRPDAVACDPFERRGLAFHERLRHEFLTIARTERVRCRVIDAARPVDIIGQEIWQHVCRRFPSLSG